MITMPPTIMKTLTMPIAMPEMAAVSRSQRFTTVSEAKRLKLSSWPGPEVAVGAEQHAHLVFGLGQLAGESACPTKMGRHSWRKAAMGSRRGGLTAGQRPENTTT